SGASERTGADARGAASAAAGAGRGDRGAGSGWSSVRGVRWETTCSSAFRERSSGETGRPTTESAASGADGGGLRGRRGDVLTGSTVRGLRRGHRPTTGGLGSQRGRRTAPGTASGTARAVPAGCSRGASAGHALSVARSEERRVGKGWRGASCVAQAK